MLFKGYRDPAGLTFAQRAAWMHAAYNGTTSEEQVTYYLTVPSRSTDGAVQLLAGLLREPRFEKDELRTERFVVLGELDRQMSDPRYHLHVEVARALWGDGWPRKNVGGELLPLMGVTPVRLREIFTRFYAPNNAALVVTGDVSAAQVFEMARKHFGGWKRRPDPYAERPVPPMASLDTARAVVVAADVRNITIMMQWQGPSVRRDPAATYAADVLADVVNDKQSGFRKRLVDSGLFESASLSYRTLDNVGPIMFLGTTTMPNLAGALTVLAAEMRLLGNEEYIEPAELELAKKRRSVESAFDLEEGTRLAHTLGYWWAVSGLDYYLGYVDNLSGQSVRDLWTFADRYIVGKPYVIGALTRPEDAQVVTTMLAQYGTLMEAW
jgi:zinc protease